MNPVVSGLLFALLGAWVTLAVILYAENPQLRWYERPLDYLFAPYTFVRDLVSAIRA